MAEIVLPETKPASEWIRGRAVQKVSPQRRHALAQNAFSSALLTWARRIGSGRVGTEWEFRIAPTGEERRPLVPDVAYLSYARVPYESPSEADIPRVAPDVVVEVLSSGDLRADIEEKIRVYLAAGTAVVFVVDTMAQTVTAHRANLTKIFKTGDEIRDSALKSFTLSVGELFEEPRPRR